MTELEKADELAHHVARLKGFESSSLARRGVVSYGTLQFEYHAADKRLVASILTADDELWDKLGDKFKRTYLISKIALTDPKIGGMFDSGGGNWRFEPATGRTYLFKAYPLDTPPTVIVHDIDAMTQIVPAWTTRWSGVVAEIAQGLAPAPHSRVTLTDDPYANRF